MANIDFDTGKSDLGRWLRRTRQLVRIERAKAMLAAACLVAFSIVGVSAAMLSALV